MLYYCDMVRRSGAGLAFVSAVVMLANFASPASAAACSVDSFVIDGVAVSVELCDIRASTPAAPTARAKSVASGSGEVRETLSVKGHPPLVRSARYERLASEETARTLDDIPLQTLGIQRTMHVTLAVRDGTARLEHALLVPGAMPLK